MVAGIATGSVAVLTEAAHSGIDLIASIVAFVSVRKADEPADAGHPYGHQKMENLAGAIEGTLILFGAAIITYEAMRGWSAAAHVHTIGVGIARDRRLGRRQHRRLARHRAPRASRPARSRSRPTRLHLSADVGVVGGGAVGLVLVALTHA